MSRLQQKGQDLWARIYIGPVGHLVVNAVRVADVDGALVPRSIIRDLDLLASAAARVVSTVVVVVVVAGGLAVVATTVIWVGTLVPRLFFNLVFSPPVAVPQQSSPLTPAS